MRAMLGKGLYVMTKGTVLVCCLGLVLGASFREMSEARCIWVFDEVVYEFLRTLFICVMELMRRRRSARLYGIERLVLVG